MRIAYVFNHAHIVGGGELSFIDLVKAIREHGVEPVPILPKGSEEIPSLLAESGFRPIRFSFPSIRGLSLFALKRRQRQLAELFDQENVDLIHVNGARTMLYCGPAAHKTGKPCVWHVRVLERDTLLDRIRGHYADTVIANSSAVAETLRKYTKTAIHVIPNGFPLSQYKEEPASELPEQYGISNKSIVVTVGRFTPQKRFEDILEACRILNSQSLSFACMLIGEALQAEKHYEHKLKELANTWGLDNVIFTGWQDNVPAILKRASVFVLPSEAEAFGRVVPEALVCGVPVIATNRGGVREILKNGKVGLMVEPRDPSALADAIKQVLTSETTAEHLKKEGRKRAEDFSLEAHAESVMNIYAELTLL